MAKKTFTEPPLAAGRSYNFVITVRDDPAERVIGMKGLNQLIPLPNIGFQLLPETRGKGYASEALHWLLRAWWALAREKGQGQVNSAGPGSEETDGNGTRPEKVYANCNKANIASFRVLMKAGFEVYQEELFDDGSTCLCLSVEQS